MRTNRRASLLALCFLCCWSSLIPGAWAQAALPEPGPENEGLRLRLQVATHARNGQTSHSVRLDLINVTNQAISLAADWPYDQDQGDFKRYLEAAASIETIPEIAPWEGQVRVERRTAPQPELTLNPHETLSVQWVTNGRPLKNVEFRPLEVRNPDFPSDGLYQVHAAVKLRLAGSSRAILLRSNEQQVPIGGGIRMPKGALGKVIEADPRTRTATIDLGSLHRIARGDQFEIRTGMSDFWKLLVGKVEETSAAGYLSPITKIGPNAMNPNPRFPTPGISAKLIRPGTR